jgi:hypothetical protein
VRVNSIRRCDVPSKGSQDKQSLSSTDISLQISERNADEYILVPNAAC